LNTHQSTKNSIRQLVLLLIFETLAVHFVYSETDSVTQYWDTSDSTNQTSIDHSQWQNFLDLYLYQTKSGQTLVAYKKVVTRDYDGLSHYLQNLTRLDPRKLNRAEQMAYWINLYNALTVKVVLDNPDKSSITKMGAGFFSFGPWNENVITITSQSLSLNDIEHRILRPIWKDERVHFALNCASLGCPNLASGTYQSKNLEEYLNMARNTYLEHKRAVHFDSAGVLHLSSLFQWYLEDFATTEPALLNYLAKHNAELRNQLLNYTGKVSYDYDWDLNRY